MLNTIFPSSESSFSVALGRSDCVKYGLAAITDNHMMQSALMVQFIQPHKFLYWRYLFFCPNSCLVVPACHMGGVKVLLLEPLLQTTTLVYFIYLFFYLDSCLIMPACHFGRCESIAARTFIAKAEV